MTSVLFFLRRQKEKVPKEKGDFFAIAPRQKKGSTLCEQFAIRLGGAGFPTIAYYYLAQCKVRAWVRVLACSSSSTLEKGAIKSSAFQLESAGKLEKLNKRKCTKLPH